MLRVMCAPPKHPSWKPLLRTSPACLRTPLHPSFELLSSFFTLHISSIHTSTSIHIVLDTYAHNLLLILILILLILTRVNHQHANNIHIHTNYPLLLLPESASPFHLIHSFSHLARLRNLGRTLDGCVYFAGWRVTSGRRWR